MRVIFFGTPEFAVPSLTALVEAGYQVAAVVTQPDMPSGRGRRLMPPPVKSWAQKLGLRVIQPAGIRDAAFIAEIKSASPDVIITAAYGRILPREILNLPPNGCVNVHASLLPKYRGASPVNAAITNGDKVTGITTMLMDEGMDTGDILLQQETEIFHDDTAGSLSKRLSVAGAALMILTLRQMEKGSLKRKPQEGEASFAPLLKKSDGNIRWERPAQELYDFIRGMNPWPGAYTYFEGSVLKILRSEVAGGKGEAGIVALAGRHELVVGTGAGLLSILEVQPQGKRLMAISDFLQGRHIEKGTRFHDKQF